MIRASLLVGALWVLALNAFGQPAAPKPYQVPTPKGWNTEAMPIPPRFAPEMTWKGMEELRFAPGMYKADSDAFLSYTLLFWLAGDQKTDAKTIEMEMLAYFRGLAKGLLRRKQQDVDVTAFSLAVKDGDKADKRPTGEAVTAYVGELKWTEPFVTVKPQTLRLDIHTWHSDKHNRNCVFICASPQPDTAAVWKTMRQLRTDTTFP
jgi:hypothetical protein